MEVFMGSIIAFGFNFPPYGWGSCNGQLLPIDQYTALYSLIGTNYGGDGQSTFGVPNLQGRVPVGQGNFLGQSYVIGQTAGSNAPTLTLANLPMHNHPGANPVSVPAYNAAGNTTSPENAILAVATGTNLYTTDNPDGAMQSFSSGMVTVSPAGGGQPFDVTDPFLAINYSIALEGLFPSRN